MNASKRDQETTRKPTAEEQKPPSEFAGILSLAHRVVDSAQSLLETGMDFRQIHHVRDIKSDGERLVECIQAMSVNSGLISNHLPAQFEMLSPMNEHMAELRNLGGDEFLAELIAEFQLQVKSDFTEIEAAAKSSDYPEVRRLAHRLKGSSTTVGLTNITELCNQLEAHATKQNDGPIAATLEHLKHVIHQSRELVQEKTQSVRILIADDHPVVRFGVRRMLQSHAQYTVVGEAADGKEAIREMREMQPDILLLDLNMPLLPGLETLRELTTIQVPTKTILLTSAISPRQILEALQLGARGVVLKDALTTDLAECISNVVKGHYWLGRRPVTNLVQVLNDLMEEIKEPPRNTFGLTTRELEVVRLIAQGMTNKDIAQECKIAEETVKRHLKNIFDKVGVWNRLELALFAINNHLATEAGAPS